MKKPKGPLTTLWQEAKSMIDSGKYEVEALQELLDKGIVMLSFLSMNGIKDKDLVENVKKEVWHERFWIATEKYIWTTFPDYEENWKCDYQ